MPSPAPIARAAASSPECPPAVLYEACGRNGRLAARFPAGEKNTPYGKKNHRRFIIHRGHAHTRTWN